MNFKSKVYLTLSITFIFGAVTALIGFFQIAVQGETKQENYFRSRTSNYIFSLKERLLRNESLLKGCAGLVYASEHVSKEEWALFVDSLQLPTNFPAIKWLGLAQVLEDDQMTSFVKTFQEKENPNFKIWPSVTNKSTPIIYVYPSLYQNLIGYNLLTSPKIAPYVGQSSFKEKVEITEEVSFTPADKSNSIFLFLYPIQNQLKSGLVEKYWTLASIDLFILVNDIAKGLGFSDINIHVYRGKAKSLSSLVFERVIQNDPTPLFTIDTPIQIGESELTFSFSTSPIYEEKHSNGVAYLIFIFIFLATGLIVFILYRFLWKEEMEKGNPTQQKPPEATAASFGLAEAIIVVDLNGVILKVSDSVATQLGYNPGDFTGSLKVGDLLEPERTLQIGKEFSQILKKELPDSLAIFAAQADTNTPKETPWTLLKKDKTHLSVRMSVELMKNKEEEVIGYIAKLHSNGK